MPRCTSSGPEPQPPSLAALRLGGAARLPRRTTTPPSGPDDPQASWEPAAEWGYAADKLEAELAWAQEEVTY
jgi:hypothetical protein